MFDHRKMRAAQIRSYSNDGLTMLGEAENLRVQADDDITITRDALDIIRRCRAEIERRRALCLPWIW